MAPRNHLSKVKNQARSIAVDPMVDLLNGLLSNTINLKLSAKQAHWNIRGENFIALHELFDKVSEEVDEYADELAEHVAQLGGDVEGTLQAVSDRTSLPPFPLSVHDSRQTVKLLADALGLVADEQRQGINSATDAGDAVTADILIKVTRGLDKLQWFVRSHIV